MAHDFVIAIINGDEIKETACFFGYAEGIIYKSFGDEHCNAMVSGNGSQVSHSKREVITSLDKILKSNSCKNYPDPTRFDGLKEFYEIAKNSNNDPIFICEYS